MNNFRSLKCPNCGFPFQIVKVEKLFCPTCKVIFPIISGIPVFGAEDEIEKWTSYHVDSANARHVAQGAYINDEPTAGSAYYADFIPSSARKVLDVGGGDGNTTALWASNHPDGEVWVMDLSLHGLRKVLRRGFPNMYPVCSAADQSFPFTNEYFDVVSTVFMIEHLDSSAQDRFYREAYRVLSPGGKLIVASDTAFYDKAIHPFERWLRNGKYVSNDPTHINLMRPRQCEKSIREGGFDLVGRAIHWVAGRHYLAKIFYRFCPAGLAERFFSTMYIIEAMKMEDDR